MYCRPSISILPVKICLKIMKRKFVDSRAVLKTFVYDKLGVTRLALIQAQLCDASAVTPDQVKI